jgi:glycosyltransferase involved in cell wall biosynthesis
LETRTAISKPSISIILAIWGQGYAQFLPQWFEAVETLERDFDEIVIVCDERNINHVLTSIKDFSKVRIRVENYEPEYANYWNRAVDLATSKWIAFCSADDYFLPQALNEIDAADEAGCNLLIDHLLHKDSSQRQSAFWDEAELNFNFRLMGANPQTKSLWEAVGGFPTGFQFPDWGFALRLKKSGLVKPFQASTDRIVYDMGYSRLTMSGATLPFSDRAKGQDQIHNLIKELEL